MGPLTSYNQLYPIRVFENGGYPQLRLLFNRENGWK